MKKLHILSFLFSLVAASVTHNTFTINQDNLQVSYENSVPCTQPTNVSHSLNNVTKCNIIWDEMAGASKYDISYRIKGTTQWDRIGSYHNYATIRNLAPNTIYQYKVRSYYNTWDFANATAIREFNTSNISITDLGLTSYETEITSISTNHDALSVEFSTTAKSNVKLSIRDVKGNLAYQSNIDNMEGLQSKTIDLSNFGGGYYMIIMESDEKSVTKKFIVA